MYVGMTIGLRTFPENARLVVVSLTKATVCDDLSIHNDGVMGLTRVYPSSHKETQVTSHTHLAHTLKHP